MAKNRFHLQHHTIRNFFVGSPSMFTLIRWRWNYCYTLLSVSCLDDIFCESRSYADVVRGKAHGPIPNPCVSAATLVTDFTKAAGTIQATAA
jgi:hypothetical protein